MSEQLVFKNEFNLPKIHIETATTFSAIKCVKCGELHYSHEGVNDEFNDDTDTVHHFNNVSLKDFECKNCGEKVFDIDCFIRVKSELKGE